MLIARFTISNEWGERFTTDDIHCVSGSTEHMMREIKLLYGGIVGYQVKEVYILYNYNREEGIIFQFEGIEYIAFSDKVTKIKKLVLPLQGKYMVDNIPKSAERIVCSPYATITNMNELLKRKDRRIRMG